MKKKDRTSFEVQSRQHRPTKLARLVKRPLWVITLFYLGRMAIKWHGSRPHRRDKVILAANHMSFLDPFVLALALDGPPITFLAKEDLFRKKYFGWLYYLLGQIPIKREGGQDALRALEIARLTVLRRHRWLGIFPEGGTPRCHAKHLHAGKRGVAWLALSEPDTRLFAVGISGTDRALPKGRWVPRLFSKVKFEGEEIDLTRFRAMEDRKTAELKLTLEIMTRIARLSGRPLSDRSYEECRDAA